MLSLINLDPALEVALMGALLALLPVSLVAWRAHRQGLRGWPAWQRVLTVLTLFLTIDLVVFGAFTRLTDSGLGCPDWPGCYGETSPFAAHAQISSAHAALPSGPVSHSKAWIEMVHRYLATGVGALITGLMLAAWSMRGRAGALSPWWSTATLVWVCAQGAFGALTVTLKLQPIIVTGHLIGAMLGVGLLTAQVRVLDMPQMPPRLRQAWAASSLRKAGYVVLALLAIQIALGAWVSTNYAVLACTEVPLCQGQWLPEMDFSVGFHLLRPLGVDSQGGFITLAALTAIHVVHRLMAVLVLLVLIAYGWGLRKWQHAPDGQGPWLRDGAALWWLAGLQLATGLSNVVLGWPLLAALVHTLGAALMVWRLVHVLTCPALLAAPREVLQGSTNNTAAGLLDPSHQGLHAGEPQASAS
ncbi:MAG: heme A synthase [Aquabacterium sp.]|uniref:COX15/CtaA family protein n=1 Tax=Aquabacterium sp. TaxID=1872578 RepID=UPI0012291F80|nr:COX15/CtaA family protein [Aquabacterium sp.]TAK98638.1 MAG: heme A synthase [Aquabacterium sp.]